MGVFAAATGTGAGGVGGFAGVTTLVCQEGFCAMIWDGAVFIGAAIGAGALPIGLLGATDGVGIGAGAGFGVCALVELVVPTDGASSFTSRMVRPFSAMGGFGAGAGAAATLFSLRAGSVFKEDAGMFPIELAGAFDAAPPTSRIAGFTESDPKDPLPFITFSIPVDERKFGAFLIGWGTELLCIIKGAGAGAGFGACAPGGGIGTGTLPARAGALGGVDINVGGFTGLCMDHPCPVIGGFAGAGAGIGFADTEIVAGCMSPMIFGPVIGGFSLMVSVATGTAGASGTFVFGTMGR